MKWQVFCVSVVVYNRKIIISHGYHAVWLTCILSASYTDTGCRAHLSILICLEVRCVVVHHDGEMVTSCKLTPIYKSVLSLSHGKVGIDKIGPYDRESFKNLNYIVWSPFKSSCSPHFHFENVNRAKNMY